MTEIKLYPAPEKLKKGVLYGGIAVAAGLVLILGPRDIENTLFGLIALGFGGYMLVTSLMYLRNPRPVFAADDKWFSVKGKPARPWSEFRGAYVHYTRSGAFTVSKSVRVKVGKSFFGGSLQIGATLLSGTAERMVEQIETFAYRVKTSDRDAVFERAVHDTPIPEAPTATPVQPAARPWETAQPAMAARTPVDIPQPALRFEQRLSAAGEGPVQSQPTLSERLFGRRKVL